MSALTDAMAAAINTLKNTVTAPSTDEITSVVHTVVDPQVAALTASIATITASEADDASKIADINAALTQFTAAFAPAVAVDTATTAS